MNVEITPARRRGDLDAFVALPYDLHRDDPLWTPALRRDIRHLLSPRVNPFFAHAEAQHFLARVGGRVVGRVSAIHNRLHNETHADRVGFFGFFECVDDRGVAADLLAAAGEWLKARGLTTIRGPASPSINDECGLLVEGFDTPAVLMMPHNPRYYVPLLESAGMRKVMDLLAYQSEATALHPRLVEGAALLQERYRITVRTLDMKRFEQEVGLIQSLYNASWERNWGFVPLTDAEIEFLAKQLRPIVVKELVLFAEMEGRTVGFGAALPDLNVALRRNRSGRLFPGILKVLWAARSIQRLRVMLLGSLPEWRGRGVDALLYKAIWENARAKGYRWAEAGWILEDNHPMNNALLRMGFEAYKRYRMYERPL